jgi:hypothetical protein
MTKLKFKQQYNLISGCESDVERIVKIFANRDYEISQSDALLAWQQYSDSMCAGWLFLYEEDDDIFLQIFHYFEEE